MSVAYFILVPRNFLRAIRCNHSSSWSELIGNLISKHLPKVEATIKVHLDQEKKNLRSTKLPDPLNVLEDIEPKEEKDSAYTGNVMCSIIDTNDITYKSYSDQTGKFPVK